MIKLFTDIDLDGLGSGIIAKLAFGENADVEYCSYRILNQRVEGFIENLHHNRDEVYITDLAVNESVEKKLDKRFRDGKHVRMLDHHVTALHFNEHKWALVKPEYDSGKKTCATSLFYDFIIEHKMMERSKGLEEFVDLVRQYDTWEWQENNNVTAKRLNDLFYILGREKFEEEMLHRLASNQDSFSLSDMENRLLDIEETKIERYIHSKNRQLVQTFIDDLCVGLVHAEQYLSELGNALNQMNPHLDMIALLNVGSKKMGFRTIHDEIDVSAYAKKYGGGGHPKASGCGLTDEAFKKYVINVFDIPPLKPEPDRNELNIKGAGYGTSYQNGNGEISFIYPQQDGKYVITHIGKKLSQVFPSFEEAELFLKRKHASRLRYDQDCLKELASSKNMPIEDIKKMYPEIVNTILNEV
ncbi:DHH family phosphoesterase [Neobacillus ginsengisoli]|uniref:Oligoribonuclease NrnB/cAMP/cGMP phosphodiesterase (DHH superfamily) n=1 Tax=Neobacillus ginsengisoli TaxID=904295 RepID=A0ABT9XX41_9BACI|nr:oligoribonuclease [Neobacillus ginsengisoli]MDQ0200123.1 oligoribonuclease NrnB/cAMP/cGMP phosphodiesterase (DHH superfamily) [Neobacillus ginsengisoli]